MAGTVFAPMHDLVRVLTLPTALRLADRFGGSRVYVPHPSRISEDHPIAQAIGLEAARQLTEEWPKFELVIPRCAPILRAERNKALRADRETLSAREAALKWELTERHVFKIWAGVDAPDVVSVVQQDLF